MVRRYTINEIFYSVQGEGARAGTANIFVRFSNCNLRCVKEKEGFDCDTEFISGRHVFDDALLDELDELSTKLNCRNIIFTGGEPGLQLDSGLVNNLHERKYYIAIETNGTLELPKGIDWISVSPKTAEHTLKVLKANEVRYVRAHGQSIPKTVIEADYYYVSPAFGGDGMLERKTLDWCINLVLQNPTWRLSVQQHKFWGAR